MTFVSNGARSESDSQANSEDNAESSFRSSPKGWLRLVLHARQYAVWASFVAVFVLFTILEPERFFAADNFRNILSSSSLTVIVAAGITVPLVMNDFDLSPVGNVAFSGALAAALQANYGWPWELAVLTALLAGLLVGVLNGFLVAGLRASSFVITLATSSVLVGLGTAVQRSKTIYTGFEEGYLKLGQSEFFGFRSPVLFAAGLVLILHVWMGHTVSGRRMLAVGENQSAAMVGGMRVISLRMVGLVTSGVIAALAGVLIFSRAGQTYVNAGAPLLLPAFAAVFLGSALSGGGRFTVAGTAVAAVLLQMVSTGLVINQVPRWSSDVFSGGVLALAILLAPRESRY